LLQFSVQIGGFAETGEIVLGFLRESVRLKRWLLFVGSCEATGRVLAFFKVTLGALDDLLNVDGPLTVGLGASSAGEWLISKSLLD
jgi:hypothetical protein